MGKRGIDLILRVVIGGCWWDLISMRAGTLSRCWVFTITSLFRTEFLKAHKFHAHECGS